MDRFDGVFLYKEKVTGEVHSAMQDDDSEVEPYKDGDYNDQTTDGMAVEEQIIRGCECPKFFSTNEEKRIHRPWRRGVIVNFLGGE